MELDEFLSRCDRVQNHGAYSTVRCPGHEDHKNSLSVRLSDNGKILLKCHAKCEAAAIVSAMGLGLADLFTNAAPKREPSSRARREPVAVYPYTDADGNVLYEVLRFEPKDFRQRRPLPGGGYEWKLSGVERVLYRLPRILEAQAATPQKAVWLVEGEKDVHTLESLGLVATTMAGGAAKWMPGYTRTLEAGPVFILPDNDDVGRAHAYRVSDLLPMAWVVELPDLPAKGDVSDWVRAGGTREKLIAIALEAKAAPKPAGPPTAPAATTDTPTEPTNGRACEWPFRALGYHAGQYFFYSPRTKQTLTLTANSMRNPVALFDLAPLQWWETHFGYEGKTDWRVAADNLVQACHKAGLFDPGRRRGRGAWLDQGRTVMHQGDGLIVDGAPTPVDIFQTSYIYELAPRLSVEPAEPAPDALGTDILHLFRRLTWDTPSGGDLLAGWVFLAPVCGILAWRPHVWLTGASGSGKTWVQEHLLAPLVGPLALRVQSVTTEAGLRQSLGQDARPILFDEAELDGDRGHGNIQRILELLRQASSDTGAMIAKGTMHGIAQHFCIRSMALLSSISVGVTRRADESRITVLTLGRPRAGVGGASHFRELQASVLRTVTPATQAALLARACIHAAAIRATADAIATEIAVRASSRRLGDQIGTLLAGSWFLADSTPPTPDQVASMISVLPLDTLAPDESTTDERACLAAIMEQSVRVDVMDLNAQSVRVRGQADRSIGELIDVVRDGYLSARDILPESAHDALRRVGLRADDDGLAVSTSHSAVATLLRGTAYQTCWGRILRRLPNTSEVRVKWPGGTVTRSIIIPWNVVNAPCPVESDQADDAQESLF